MLVIYVNVMCNVKIKQLKLVKRTNISDSKYNIVFYLTFISNVEV